MKKSFRIFSIILAVAVLMSAMIIPASAAIPPQKYGDTNSDGNIDIMDATAVQRYLAKIDLRAIQLIESADVNNDVKITIFDVTIIQQYVAQILTEFPAGKVFYIDKYFYGVTVDYDKDKAMVGYPVTFSARGSMSPGPTTARLYVNEELVVQTQERNEETNLFDLTYTFEKAGAYRVEVTLSDKWGNTYSHIMSSWTALYTVKDAPADLTTPVITALTIDTMFSSSPVFTTTTKFGTEPYQYKYTLDSFYGEVFSTDFTDSNILKIADMTINDGYLEWFRDYTIKVEVKDANGKIATDSLNFRLEKPAPA